MRKTIALLMTMAFAAGTAFAKLPPPTPEAAAAAAAAKDKTAWSDKVAAYKLCLAQDRVAKHYLQAKEGARKPSVETPPCVDPGPYAPSVEAATPAAPADSAAPAAAPAKK